MRTFHTYLITAVSIGAMGYALFLSSETTPSRIFLDDVMTRKEQKATGVYNLNHNQKLALEDWINDTFMLKSPMPPSAEDLSIAENLDGGQALKLSNGEIYEVAPADVEISSLWIFPFPIAIVEGENPDYPLMIVNKNTNVSVNVRIKPGTEFHRSPAA